MKKFTDEQIAILVELYRDVAYSHYETRCIFRGVPINCDCGYVCEFLENILYAEHDDPGDSFYLMRLLDEVKDVPVSAKNASASELSDR